MRLRDLDRMHARLSALAKADSYYDEQAALIRSAIYEAQANISSTYVTAIVEAALLGPTFLDNVLVQLDDALGDSLGESVRDTIRMVSTRVYSRGIVDVIGEAASFDFSDLDERVLRHLESTEGVYWVGNYWGDQMRTSINEALVPLFRDGANQDQIAEAVGDALADRLRRSESYWDGFSNNLVTRSRSFGITEAAVEAGFEVGIIDAVVDDRTSDICRALDGQRVRVASMVELRDSLLNAQSPEDVRTIAPWLQATEVRDHIDSGELPVGLSLPPYHFRCRTTLRFE